MKNHRAFVLEDRSFDVYVKLILTHFLGPLMLKMELDKGMHWLVYYLI